MSTAPHAVLDIGSNTVRLLVGRVQDGRVDRLLDRSEFIRLGKDVDATGELQQDRMDAALRAISSLSEEARSLGAESITAIATSAVRDARNAEGFVRRVRDETGVDIEIISGDREAELTYRGATIAVDRRSGVIVCDLGGGSAELIAADERGIRWSVSKPLGSGRLSERFVHHDPPTREEVDAVRQHVRETLESLSTAHPGTIVFTGGTASHLEMLAGKSGQLETLGIPDIERVVGLLLSIPAAEITARYGVRPERAQVLPAGIAALEAIARFYGANRTLVSLSGIREGALLEEA